MMYGRFMAILVTGDYLNEECLTLTGNLRKKKENITQIIIVSVLKILSDLFHTSSDAVRYLVI